MPARGVLTPGNHVPRVNHVFLRSDLCLMDFPSRSGSPASSFRSDRHYARDCARPRAGATERAARIDEDSSLVIELGLAFGIRGA